MNTLLSTSDFDPVLHSSQLLTAPFTLELLVMQYAPINAKPPSGGGDGRGLSNGFNRKLFPR